MQKGRRIRLPTCLIEVNGEEEAGFVEEHRIDARDKWLIRVVSARQMAANDIVGDRQESTMRAFRALDARLFADAPDPLVGTRRRVA